MKDVFNKKLNEGDEFWVYNPASKFLWGYSCSFCKYQVGVERPPELPEKCPGCNKKMVGYIGS